MGSRTENQNRILVNNRIHINYISINNCHICVTFGCSLSKHIRTVSLSLKFMYMCFIGSKHSWNNIRMAKVLCYLRKNSLWICTCTHCVHFSTKFRENLSSVFSGVVKTNCFSIIFNFEQISIFKSGIIPRKTMNRKFQRIYIICPYNYKITWNSVERIQRSNCFISTGYILFCS